MPRLDTKLEAEGAEFLVLGQLLLQRIPAYKTYTNLPGYDLVATNPDTNRAARIQVKSRWRTCAPFFLIKKFDCDFVVAVRLNRGKKSGGVPASPPEYFMLPVEIVKSIHRPGPWPKVVFKDIDSKYRENWSLIAEFLAGESSRRTAGRGTTGCTGSGVRILAAGWFTRAARVILVVGLLAGRFLDDRTGV